MGQEGQTTRSERSVAVCQEVQGRASSEYSISADTCRYLSEISADNISVDNLSMSPNLMFRL
jgi:hypothetical protein